MAIILFLNAAKKALNLKWGVDRRLSGDIFWLLLKGEFFVFLGDVCLKENGKVFVPFFGLKKDRKMTCMSMLMTHKGQAYADYQKLKVVKREKKNGCEIMRPRY